MGKLNQMLRGWANYFSQQSLPCGGSTYPQKAASVAMRQTPSKVAGEETIPDGVVLQGARLGQSYRTDR